MKSILKKHIITTVLLSMLIVALGIGALLGGRMFARHTQEVLKARQKIATYEVHKKSFQEEAAQVKDIQTRVNALKQSVVTKESLPSFLSSLESLARASEVQFDITGVETPVVDDVAHLEVEVTIDGTFAQATAFLSTLLHQPYTIAINRLDIVSGAAATARDVAPTAPGVKKAAPVVKEPVFRTFATLEVKSF